MISSNLLPIWALDASVFQSRRCVDREVLRISADKLTQKTPRELRLWILQRSLFNAGVAVTFLSAAKRTMYQAAKTIGRRIPPVGPFSPLPKAFGVYPSGGQMTSTIFVSLDET